MKRIALFLAALALSPLVAGCNRGVSGETAQSVTIPFAPPIGQPLYYRFQRTSQDAGAQPAASSLFMVTFTRAPDGLFMTISALRPNGARVSETGVPAALAERRFRVGPDGKLLGMENEAAYWAAIEPMLAPRGPSEAEARESRAMLRAAHDMRGLPLADRMTHLAQDAWAITYYAGHTYTREPRDAPASKQSVAGEIGGTLRTFVREVSPRRIVIVERFVIAPERMQAALDNIAARYSGRPANVGSRHMSNVSEVTIDLDPRTGLVQRRRDRQELVTEEAGRTLRRGETTLLERIDALPAPAPARPAGSRSAR